MLSVGERTIGVLTKIDLMDKGTDAVDVSHFCYHSGIKLPIKEDLLDFYSPSLNKWNLKTMTANLMVMDYYFLPKPNIWALNMNKCGCNTHKEKKKQRRCLDSILGPNRAAQAFTGSDLYVLCT